MNILIVGCGKVGANLAMELQSQNYDISIIASSEEAFEYLPEEFAGLTTCGVEIDQDALKKAGIENCDAIAAVTSDDNVNLMVSQLAKEIFNVPKVITRIYDPRRGDVFNHFGLNIICPTNLTVSAISADLRQDNSQKNLNLCSHMVSFTRMEIPRKYIGERVSQINMQENEVLYAIERDEMFMLIGLRNIELQKGDILIFSKFVD